MKTVRILLAMVVALAIAIPAMAQEKKDAKGKGKISPTGQLMLRMGKLKEALEGLDLTAEQQENLKKIHEEMGPKMKDIFGKMREILTEEQHKTAEDAAKKAKEAKKEGRAMILAIQAALKLSDEQQEKIDKLSEGLRPLNREMMKKVSAILTPEQQENLKKKMAPQPRKKGEKKEPQKES